MRWEKTAIRASARRGERTSSRDLSEIVAIAFDQAHALGVAPAHDAEPVVLDFVHPVQAVRRGLGWRRQAGLDKTGCAVATL
jgi:hypothetical protein